MKQTLLCLIILGTLVYAGCNPNVTKQEFAPKMYTERPLSILVLPPINKSTAADAKEYYTTTIAEPLTNSGYYVLPIEVVNDVLKQEGLFDTETMSNVPVQKFKEYFGVDAVLYVTILQWNTSYLITSGSVNVKLACELKSTKSGEVLWFYDDVVEVSTEGSSGGAGGWVGLLVKAATTAIKTAATDYVPLARKANAKILVALPCGRYNQSFNQDGGVRIERKKSLEDKPQSVK